MEFPGAGRIAQRLTIFIDYFLQFLGIGARSRQCLFKYLQRKGNIARLFGLQGIIIEILLRLGHRKSREKQEKEPEGTHYLRGFLSLISGPRMS